MVSSFSCLAKEPSLTTYSSIWFHIPWRLGVWPMMRIAVEGCSGTKSLPSFSAPGTHTFSPSRLLTGDWPCAGCRCGFQPCCRPELGLVLTAAAAGAESPCEEPRCGRRAARRPGRLCAGEVSREQGMSELPWKRQYPVVVLYMLSVIRLSCTAVLLLLALILVISKLMGSGQ